MCLFRQQSVHLWADCCCFPGRCRVGDDDELLEKVATHPNSRFHFFDGNSKPLLNAGHVLVTQSGPGARNGKSECKQPETELVRVYIPNLMTGAARLPAVLLTSAG